MDNTVKPRAVASGFLPSGFDRRRRACAITLTVLALWLIPGCGTWPASYREVPPPPAAPIDLPHRAPHASAGAELTITRITHSCLLINFGGEYVLTDPWFTESSQYKHGEPLGMRMADLPPLTAIVVSHDHYDHFDIDAMMAYPDKTVPMFVAPGMAPKARSRGFTRVYELESWTQRRAGQLMITATPGAHSVPEQTYVIAGHGYTVFFGGDTLHIPELSPIVPRLGPIDVALVPVNGLHIIPLLDRQVVMSAREAAALVAEMRPAVAIPIHYAFRGGWFTEPFVLRRDGDPEEFAEMVTRHASEVAVRILPTGQPLSIRRRQ